MNDLLEFWRHLPSMMKPYLAIGPFHLRYYGMAYLAVFLTVYFVVKYRLRREERFDLLPEQFQSLMLSMVFGALIGARLGYVLFYNLPYYLDHPMEILLPFSFDNGIRFTGIAGMSYHGGLLGALAGAWLYIRKTGLDFREMSDLIAPVFPLGYTFGRLGNFVNGELYGRVTDSPIGMVFPSAPDMTPRHPSQLYEAFFEGIFLFAVLWSIRGWRKVPGAMLAFYIIGYGTVRFFIEFFREPDGHIGFVLGPFSMGQILCAVMIGLGGALFLFFRWRVNRPADSP